MALAILGAIGCGGSSDSAVDTTPTPAPSATATPFPAPSLAAAWAVGGAAIRSLDGGRTWDVIHANAALHDVAFVDRQTGWAVGGAIGLGAPTVLHTDDGGTTWSDQSEAANTIVTRSIGAVAALNTLHAVIVGEFSPAFVSFNGPVLTRLTADGGASWDRTPVDTDGQPTSGLGALRDVCLTHGGHGLTCGSSYHSRICHATADGGARWRNVSDLVRGPAVACVGDATLWNASAGRLDQSTDGGVTWTERSGGLPTDFTGQLRALTFTTESLGWAVGDEDGQPLILHTNDGGDRWTRQVAPDVDEGRLHDVAFADADIGIAVGLAGDASPTGERALAFFTSDGGDMWHTATLPLDLGPLRAVSVTP